MQKRLRGCDGNAELPHILFGETLRSCPKRPVLDDPASFNYWMRLYRHYQLGLLPDEGGVFEQSAMVITVFAILDGIYSEVREAQDEAREKGKRRMKRPKRRSEEQAA